MNRQAIQIATVSHLVTTAQEMKKGTMQKFGQNDKPYYRRRRQPEGQALRACGTTIAA
jgi:hypothetical protein